MNYQNDTRVLVVDDNEQNLGVVGNILIEQGYRVSLVSNSREAFDSLNVSLPDIILLDVMMPEMNGFETCRILKEDEKNKEIPVIFLTARSDTKDVIKGFQVGGVDYIPKPFRKEELLARVNTHLKLRQTEKSLKETILIKEDLLRSETSMLDGTLKGSIKVLIEILSIRSPFLFNHSNRMRNIVRKLTTRLDIEKAWEVEIAVLLSHIGCVTIPNDILEKKYRGEEVSESDSSLFYSHPLIGKKLLSNIPRLEKVAESIYYQYKKFDGGGFPNDDLKGKSIPIIARILKVLNDFETYLNIGKTFNQALELMRKSQGSYDPELLDALESEILNVKEGYVVRSILFNELITGMVLADDILDVRSIVLVSKGKEITETLKILLHNYVESGSLIEPIKVLIPAKLSSDLIA